MEHGPISKDTRLKPHYNVGRDIDNVVMLLPKQEIAAWQAMYRGHMQPDIVHGLFIDCLGVLEDPDATGSIPYEQFVDFLNEEGVVKVVSEPYWAHGARFNAPGYMDCTDWTTFPSAVEAVKHLLSEGAPDHEGEEE